MSIGAGTGVKAAVRAEDGVRAGRGAGATPNGQPYSAALVSRHALSYATLQRLLLATTAVRLGVWPCATYWIAHHVHD